MVEQVGERVGDRPVDPVLDRFEGPWAVIEFDHQGFNFPRSLLPQDAREGDTLRFTVEIDTAATKRRRRRIMKLEDDLFR